MLMPIGPVHTGPLAVHGASRLPSLDRLPHARKIARGFRLTRSGITPLIHRFEEIIGGRTYQIEVTPVSNRWRAQIQRIPGMPTALMPFYGQTPDEAARHLSQWLMLANRRQSAPAPAAASSTSTL